MKLVLAWPSGDNNPGFGCRIAFQQFYKSVQNAKLSEVQLWHRCQLWLGDQVKPVCLGKKYELSGGVLPVLLSWTTANIPPYLKTTWFSLKIVVILCAVKPSLAKGPHFQGCVGCVKIEGPCCKSRCYFIHFTCSIRWLTSICSMGSSYFNLLFVGIFFHHQRTKHNPRTAPGTRRGSERVESREEQH